MEKEKQEEITQPQSAEDPAPEIQIPVEPPPKKRVSTAELQKEIEQLKTELTKSQNDYFKAYADLDNLKKRLLKQQEDIIKYKAQNLALDLLDSVDNLERALKDADPTNPLTKGVQMIYDQLINSLKKEGVEAIVALDQPVDYNKHHAIESKKVKGVKPGIVIAEMQKGYMIKDRLLRASVVKISE